MAPPVQRDQELELTIDSLAYGGNGVARLDGFVVFVRRGLVPDGGGAYLLPRLVGPRRAKELMFFGDDLRAADAERLGLVNRVVPDGELEKTVRAWAERLAAGPTRTLALTKQLVNASLDVDRATAFAAEAATQELNMTTADAAEGLRRSFPFSDAHDALRQHHVFQNI